MKDISSSGRETPWEDKKIKSYFISKSFNRLGYTTKSERIAQCGTFLEFKRFLSDDSLKLNQANFCKVRLCPMCTWRRSLKIFGQVSKVMNEATKIKDSHFLFLTLTVKNCKGADLSETIDLMMKGFSAMFRRARVKKSILGCFRALEITHNTNKHSKSFDTYHPHFHCVLMVNKSYFTSRNYIKQNEWAEMWKQVVGLDYEPIVHIETIKNSEKNIQKAVAETAKYSVKDTDILNPDEDLQDSAVHFLSNALHGRRLHAFLGEFDKIRKKLKLDDVDNGDLITCDVSDNEVNNELDYIIERYCWHIGYKQYVRLDNNNEYEKRGN